MHYLDLAEVFGHGIGVTMIMIGTFASIDPFSFHRSVGLQFAGLPFSQQREKDLVPGCCGLMLGPLAVLLMKQLVTVRVLERRILNSSPRYLTHLELAHCC